VIELLRRSSLFAALPDAALEIIAAECRAAFAPGQSTVFRQGDAPDGMYLVDRGRLRIVDESGGEERVLGHVGRGGHLGEVSLLTGDVRAATAIAVRDTSLLRLDPDSFHRVMETHPTVALALARSVTKMLLAPPQAENPVSTIAVVPTAQGADVDIFAKGLGRALRGLGRTAFLDAERMAREAHGALGALGDAQAARELNEVFERVESAHDFTLYIAEAADTPWTRRCIRHADLILEVARGDGDQRDSPGVLLHSTGERHLVLTHEGGRTTRPRPGAWLRAHPYDAHHLVDVERPADFARLARLVGGRAHGLALSGGGARTAAFVGVLHALAEADVPIDVVGGTSGGAILGAMCALGWDTVQMREAMQRIDKTPMWLDLCPPLLSILSGRVYERMLRGLFGAAAIEDLAVPFLPVCARLHDGQVVVPSRGEIWRAVRASSSLPGIWPPVLFDGRLVVDGGISNNLPIDLVRARCGRGPIIACDVGASAPLEGVPSDIQATSGWSLLLSRFLPWRRKPRVPGLLEVVVRATCAGGTRHRTAALAQASLFIEPLSVAGGTSVEALEQRGYDAARAALEPRQRGEDH
jgi:predicted acylesterase/phospholipase RssA